MTIRYILISLLLSVVALASAAIEPSGTLPVLHIDTDGGAQITSKETYITGTYWLETCGDADIEAIGSREAPLPLQIRGRGNYSWWGFDKKPYRIKLDKKAALLGCNKSKHFALLAHADDNVGFLRNIVGFELSRLIGLAWTPEDRPCELILNGKYEGLYFLTETVRVDSDRVNIIEQADNATDAEEITGGWLVEIDNYDSDPHVRIHEQGNNDIIFTYKTPEVLSAAQEQWLTTEMTRINELIYADDTDNCQWADYIDLDELARYYIVQEITDDYESFHGSCYLYRDRGEGNKWMFGPVWDFGSAFTCDKNDYINHDRVWHQTWIAGMVRFPAFMQRVKDVWNTFYSEHAQDIIDYTRAYGSQIAAATARDAERWPAYGNADEAAAVDLVVRRLRHAMDWLDDKWGDHSVGDDVIEVYFEDDNIAPWSAVKAYVWDHNATYYPLGGWPGTDCELVEGYNGYPMWKISFNPTTRLTEHAGLIFNNGGYGPGNQTDDFVLRNKGIYRMSGFYSGVESVSYGRDIDIECLGAGRVRLRAATGTYVSIVDIVGRTSSVMVTSGETTIALNPGLYIIAGKKIAVK